MMTKSLSMMLMTTIMMTTMEKINYTTINYKKQQKHYNKSNVNDDNDDVNDHTWAVIIQCIHVNLEFKL